MTQSEFTTALRTLLSISNPGSALLEKVEYDLGWKELSEFMAAPAHFYDRADEATQDRLWNIIEGRAGKKQLLAAE